MCVITRFLRIHCKGYSIIFIHLFSLTFGSPHVKLKCRIVFTFRYFWFNVSTLLFNCYTLTISVARGGGGGHLPPPPNNAFSEFCRYIWKFVGTYKPTSMSFVPTKYLKYQQNIERNSSFRNVKMRKFSKLARSARSHIHRFSQCYCFVSILSFTYTPYHK